MDTAGILALSLTAAIVAGRARRAARRTDLLMADGFLVMALATLFLSLLPTIAGDRTRTFSTWAGEAVLLLALCLFLWAALGPDVALERPDVEVTRGLLGAVGAFGFACAVMAALTSVLPEVDKPVGASATSRDVLAGPASLATVEFLLGLGLLCAVVAFARRSARWQDPFLGWVAAGLTLAAFARVGYALFPSQYGDYVYVGDFFALAAFLVLFAGAAFEVLGRQAALAEAAIREERRRLARDLHDGLAQELAFITAQTRRLSRGERGEGPAEDLLAAAERALEESRLAISGLVRRGNENLERTLEQAATSTASRAGVEVILDLDPGLEVSPAVQQSLLRVQSQAIVNAAVHGRARRVTVRLARLDDMLRLAIEDDGTGFDTDAQVRPDSLGLLSMRERAEALGGELHVTSAVGEGTQVLLVLPSSPNGVRRR
jgi:signal transduction histidine kinase